MSTEDADYDNDDSSDEMDANDYYKLTRLPPTFPVSYASRKTETKNDASILPLRKSIMVGSSYQASIPELIKKPATLDKKKSYLHEDKLVWNPYRLSDKDVEKYLCTVQKIQFEKARGIEAIPRGSHTRDDEQALYLLLQCGFNVDKALQKIKSTPPRNNASTHWTEEECKNFESGIRIYGKEFFLIRSSKVKSRTVGELVQFYYLWKKTERHDVFANRVKLEKKKYSLHPGITFFDDHEEGSSFKDGNFTNIQCLIYGDAKKFQRATDLMNHTFYENVSSENRTKSWNNHVNSRNSQV